MLILRLCDYCGDGAQRLTTNGCGYCSVECMRLAEQSARENRGGLRLRPDTARAKHEAALDTAGRVAVACAALGIALVVLVQLWGGGGR